MRMKKRRLKKIARFIILLLSLAILALIILIMLKTPSKTYDRYTASKDVNIKLYDRDFNEIKEVKRGLKVASYEKQYKKDDKTYIKIKYDDMDYYVSESNLVSEYEKTVQEDKMYVRTPVTVYKDNTSSLILGFKDKGSSLDIVGFDKMENGVVNMYKVKYDDTYGYIYSKYLVNNLDAANKEYEAYEYHKDRKFSYELYGGYAKELDYYPYEKASFINNVMPEETKTLYLNADTISSVDNYIALAKEATINAFVVDIYDGYLAFPSEVAKEYSPSAYASARWKEDEFKSAIDKLKNEGFYVIARIVAFNNPHFAKDNLDDAISYNGKATSWVSAYSRRAWEYNVLLALEVIEKFGFNEIQYDYIRFPESSYSWSKNNKYDFKNKYNESKGEAIQNFLFYATDVIHSKGAYISADVFGECAYAYVTAYGQYWPAISNIVDVISAMPYPDHFNKYDFGFKEAVWTKPYELMLKWAGYAKERQSEIPTPAKVRTWIQAYDSIREPYVKYGANEVEGQIKALYEMGLNDGFIPWHSASNINKYRTIKPALIKEYR